LSGTLERTSKDGKKTVYERKAGNSVWLEADSDVVKNIGKTTFVVVSVQSRMKPLPWMLMTAAAISPMRARITAW
jgi:hypothetical protein